MSLGYVIWGTESGLNSNIVGNPVVPEIISELKNWDAAIRSLAQRGKEHFYCIHQLGGFCAISLIDPNKKDALDREGYLASTLYFSSKVVYQDALAVLKDLNILYFNKSRQKLNPTEQECNVILTRLIASTKPHVPEVSFAGRFILAGLQPNELGLVLSNTLLGFSPSVAFIFSASGSNTAIQMDGFNTVSYSMLATEHNRIAQLLKDSGDQAQKNRAGMAMQMRMVAEMIQRGTDSAQVFELLSSLSKSDNASLLSLLATSEFSPYQKWYEQALEWQKQKEYQAHLIEAQRQLPNIRRHIKDGKIEDAERILGRFPPQVRNTLNEMKKLESEVKTIKNSFIYKATKSKDPKDKGAKQVFLGGVVALGILVIVGIGLALRPVFADEPKVAVNKVNQQLQSDRDKDQEVLINKLTKQLNANEKILITDIYTIARAPFPEKFEGKYADAGIMWNSKFNSYILKPKGQADTHIPLEFANQIASTIKGSEDCMKIFKQRPLKSVLELAKDSSLFLKLKNSKPWFNYKLVTSTKIVNSTPIEIKELYYKSAEMASSNFKKVDLTKVQIGSEVDSAGLKELKYLHKLIFPNASSAPQNAAGNQVQVQHSATQPNPQSKKTLSAIELAFQKVKSEYEKRNLTPASYNNAKMGLSPFEMEQFDNKCIQANIVSRDRNGKIKLN